MRSRDTDMIMLSKRVTEQSNMLDRIVQESNILRATSDKLLETISAHLSAIKLELGRLERQGRREPQETPPNPRR